MASARTIPNLAQIAPAERRGKRHVDKLIEVVRLDGATALVLIHIEVQSQQDETFAERMFCYHARLLDRYRQPIVSLAVLGDDNPDWLPLSFSRELWNCHVELVYPTLKLQSMNEAALEASTNIFATMILIHRDALATRGDGNARITRRAACYRRALSLGYSSDDIRTVLRLIDLVLRVPQTLLPRSLQAMKEVEEEMLVKTLTPMERYWRTKYRREARQEGRQEGHQEGMVKGISAILNLRFGTASQRVIPTVASISDTERLADLLSLSQTIASVDDFAAALARPPLLPESAS